MYWPSAISSPKNSLEHPEWEKLNEKATSVGVFFIRFLQTMDREGGTIQSGSLNLLGESQHKKSLETDEEL